MRLIAFAVMLMACVSAALPAAPVQQTYMADYIQATDGLTKILSGVGGVDQAKAALSPVQDMVARISKDKDLLKRAPLDQRNAEHQAAFKSASSELTRASAQLHEQMNRIKAMPKVYQVLSPALAGLR